MEVTLELNGKKEKAKVSFAQPADFGFAKGWKQSIGNDQNPVMQDTVDYAELAVKRYEATFGTGIYATSFRDFTDHIASNPRIEVAGFIVLRCNWFPVSEIIGFSHFRRTWCNKIILDFLGTHPLIVRPPENATHKVRGVGVALLYFIIQLLKRENCSALWGEATSSSGTYYQKIFKLGRVEDLILAPRENLIAFADETEREWLTNADAGSTLNQPLGAIYALEVDNPPFVGSKMAVFNPSKRLAYRFLKLAYHKQVEIAIALQCVACDSPAIPVDELAQAVFKHARDKMILSVLWDLVEKQSGVGTLEENPFNRTSTQIT